MSNIKTKKNFQSIGYTNKYIITMKVENIKKIPSAVFFLNPGKENWLSYNWIKYETYGNQLDTDCHQEYWCNPYSQ